MFETSKKSCIRRGKEFSHGSYVCDSDKCVVCEDGDWAERFEDEVFGVGP